MVTSYKILPCFLMFCMCKPCICIVNPSWNLNLWGACISDCIVEIKGCLLLLVNLFSPLPTCLNGAMNFTRCQSVVDSEMLLFALSESENTDVGTCVTSGFHTDNLESEFLRSDVVVKMDDLIHLHMFFAYEWLSLLFFSYSQIPTNQVVDGSWPEAEVGCVHDGGYTVFSFLPGQRLELEMGFVLDLRLWQLYQPLNDPCYSWGLP